MNEANLLRLTVDGIANGSQYALLGASFGMILFIANRFHFAYTLTYTLAAFTTALLANEVMPFAAAVIVGILAAAVSGVVIEGQLYRTLDRRARGNSLLGVFVAALGLSIAGENLIQLLWGGNGATSISAIVPANLHFGPVQITNISLAAILISWALMLMLGLLMRFTNFGRQVRAVRSNPELAEAFGIRVGRVRLIVFAIASALAGVLAIFETLRFATTSDMGFNPLVYAFVVAFLVGSRGSPLKLAVVGTLLGLVESYSQLWISEQLSKVVVFSVLIIYLVSRGGFVSLQRLRLPGRVLARRAS